MLGAQVFYIDPNIVAQTSQVGISAIDLYFQSAPSANANISGILYPGVTCYLVPTQNNVPVLDNLPSNPSARLAYTDILPSSDASQATTVSFSPPVFVNSGQYYALVIIPDGNENFTLWTSVIGNTLVGSNTIDSGPTGNYLGAFYEPISVVPIAPANGSPTANTSMVSTGNSSSNSIYPTSDYTTAVWTPLAGTDLKFTVYCARYAVQGNNAIGSFVSNGSLSAAQVTTTTNVTQNAVSGEFNFGMPAWRYDYIQYNPSFSSNNSVMVGERVYQNTVFYPGGTNAYATVSVTANSTTVTGTGVNWSTLLNVGGFYPEYIVITSKNAQGPNADIVAVRQVVGLVSNTVIQVDEPLNFSNSAAYFFRSPVAVVDQWESAKFFGVSTQVMITTNVTSNTSMRFVNDSIITLLSNAVGTGYANSDVVTVSGFEAVSGKVIGGYVAKANVVTFANGTIANVFLANLGAGFVNASAIAVSVANSTGGSSNGSGATWVYTVGSTIKSEFLGLTGTGGFFCNCKMLNIEVGEVMPALIVSNPAETAYTAFHRMPYYSIDDLSTFIGKTYYCDSDGNWDQYQIQSSTMEFPWQFTKRRCIMSWSNELVTPYANGTSCGGAGGSTVGNNVGLLSNSSVIEINCVSNSDFASMAITPATTTITFLRYIINNDANHEITNYGNAWAKGVEVQFNLANSAFAEDLIVYLTAYQPPNTSILVYARVNNSQDPDPLATRDWTQLQLTGGGNVYSSPTQISDYKQYTYSFFPYPQAMKNLAGYANVANNSATITGSGTTWSSNLTVNLVSGSLVLIQQPLFPNNYAVAVVNVVSNDTSFTINYPIVNNNIEGSGLTVSLLTQPHQAFHEYLNANIAAYYNTEMVKFSTFDTAQLKIVMLSANNLTVPFIANLQCAALSI